MGKRFRNENWELPATKAGGIETWDGVKVAVLMDIRDELQKLNRVFECENFLRIPRDLQAIRRNTNKPRRNAKP